MLAILPAHNRLFRRDVTGAFEPEAERWADLHCAQVRRIDNRLSEPLRLAEVVDVLSGLEARSQTCVAFFCHGTPTALQLAGPLGSTRLLGTELARVLRPGGSVALYACSTAARLDNSGFAVRLRNSIFNASLLAGHAPHWGGWVDAHDRAGHCCRNPYVVRIEATGGAFWLVDPTGPQWKLWRRRLQDKHDQLRYAFPTVPRGPLLASLGAV